MKRDQFLTKVHGLRGYSIILVLLFHFFEPIFKGGYLGVDLFFLISGFIVTKSTQKYWPNSFKDNLTFLKIFYVNRIARLIPVGLLISSLSLILSLIFTSIGNTETVVNFFRSSIVGFTNILLFLNQQNYFSQSQEFNFFTQMWSLGVEEQFYFIFTILISLISLFPQKRSFVFLGITILSCLINSRFFSFSQEAHFFLLPFRLWEMSLGALVFLEVKKIKHFFYRKRKFFEYYAPLTLCGVLFIKYSPSNFPFPILLFLFPSIIYIMAFSDEAESGSKIDRALNNKLLQFFGTISYSLYLIHWPIVVFTKYAFGKDPIFMMTGMFLSIFVAHFVTHKFEIPLNISIKKNNRYVIYTLGTASLLIVISSYFINTNPIYIGGELDASKLQWKHEFINCIEDTDNLKERIRNCFSPRRDQNRSVIFAAGDSHAGQIALMLRSFGRKTNFEVLLYHSGDKPNSIHGFRRTDWNESPQIFEQLIKNGKENDIVVLTFASFHFVNASNNQIKKAHNTWVKYLSKLVKKKITTILVIDSPYYPDYPIEACIFDSKFKSGQRCKISRNQYLEQRYKQERFFLSISKKIPGIFVWDMIDEFCNNKCSIINNGRIDYFDYNHISKERALRLEKGFTDYFNKLIIK